MPSEERPHGSNEIFRSDGGRETGQGRTDPDRLYTLTTLYPPGTRRYPDHKTMFVLQISYSTHNEDAFSGVDSRNHSREKSTTVNIPVPWCLNFEMSEQTVT